MSLNPNSNIDHALSHYNNSKKLKHNGLKGEAREIFVKDLFKNILLTEFLIASGIMLDRYGNQSAQTDLILFSDQIIPPYMFDEQKGLFPIEACIYNFEVKTTLNAAEIKDTISKFKKLEQFHNIYFSRHGPSSTMPITVLFAFESDLKGNGEEEFNRFINLINDAGLNKYGIPFIRILCIVGKGYWYYADGLANETKQARWFSIKNIYHNSEVRNLIGGVINTIRIEKQKRYGLPFGMYIIDD